MMVSLLARASAASTEHLHMNEAEDLKLQYRCHEEVAHQQKRKLSRSSRGLNPTEAPKPRVSSALDAPFKLVTAPKK